MLKSFILPKFRFTSCVISNPRSLHSNNTNFVKTQIESSTFRKPPNNNNNNNKNNNSRSPSKEYDVVYLTQEGRFDDALKVLRNRAGDKLTLATRLLSIIKQNKHTTLSSTQLSLYCVQIYQECIRGDRPDYILIFSLVETCRFFDSPEIPLPNVWKDIEKFNIPLEPRTVTSLSVAGIEALRKGFKFDPHFALDILDKYILPRKHTSFDGLSDLCDLVSQIFQTYDDISSSRKLFDWMIANKMNHYTLFTGYTCVSFLDTCQNKEALDFGEKIHHLIKEQRNDRRGLPKDSFFVDASILRMYIKCGMEEKRIFDLFADIKLNKMRTLDQERSVVYHTMIKYCFDIQNIEIVKQLLAEMHSSATPPDKHTFLNIFNSCEQYSMADASFFYNFFITNYASLIDSDIVKSLVTLFTKLYGFSHSLIFLETIIPMNVVLDEAFFVSLIYLCAQNGSLQNANRVHQLISNYKSNLGSLYESASILGALVNMDSKFDIINYDLAEKAIQIFIKKQENHEIPQFNTYAILFSVCAKIVAPHYGEIFHRYLCAHTHEAYLTHPTLVGTMINMYGKCGNYKEAENIFKAYMKGNRKPTEAIIGATVHTYAINGQIQSALEIFDSYLPLFSTDSQLFTSALLACSHGGLVEKAKEIYYAMETKYNLSPDPFQHSCMIDTLSRSGNIQEAIDLVETIIARNEENKTKITTKDIVIYWKSVLGGCRIHNDVNKVEYVAEKILEYAHDDASAYVMVLSTFLANNNTEKEGIWRARFNSTGISKIPGQTSGLIDGNFHSFTSGDVSGHGVESNELDNKVNEMQQKLKEHGHVFDTTWVVKPTDDMTHEQKVHSICRHSEKIAIAFYLLKTPPTQNILLTKNLRVCGDCHEATKKLSVIYGREIVIRDMNRFHHFVNGKCSCGDYF